MKVLHMITIMISTVFTIGTYPMLDTNTIHNKRRVIGQKVLLF